MKWLMPRTTLLQILTILSLGSWSTCATLASPKSSWPPGTVAKGSSTHAAIEPQRNFYSSYAIDGDTDSFWNDDTENALPDILIIEVPSPVILDGIILLSSTIKWVLGYTVKTLSDSDNWILQARVTNCESALHYVRFNSSVKTTQLRIEVTDEQDEYARINEVYPVFAASTSNPSESNPTASETKPSSSTTAGASAVLNSSSLPSISNSSNSPKNSSNTIAAIVGGILGAFVLILCILLALLLFRRKRKISPDSNTPTNNTDTYSPQPQLDQSAFEPERSIFRPAAELSNHHRYGYGNGISVRGNGGGQTAYQKPELESR